MNLNTLNLDFGFNKIGAKGLEKLSEILSKLKNLTTLDLKFQKNGINRQESRFIGNSLSQFLKFPVFRLYMEEEYYITHYIIERLLK
jgi:hypothetical protein